MTALIPFFDGCEDCPTETLELNLMLAFTEFVLRMECVLNESYRNK